jgi:hypothetical protein
MIIPSLQDKPKVEDNLWKKEQIKKKNIDTDNHINHPA